MLDHLTTLYRRITNAIRPCKQTTVSDESGVISKVQGQFNSFETRSIMSPQLFGLASATLPGTDLIVLNTTGDNADGCVVASNHQQYRPTGMMGGEVQIYDSLNQSVYLKTDGSIRITANHKVIIVCDTETDITAPTLNIISTSAVNITSPLTTITGDLKITGTVIGDSETISLQNHTHSGVQTGSGHSGPPVPGS